MQPDPNFDAKKEEITDLLNPAVYDRKDEEGRYIFHKGLVLKFNYEGSLTSIRITRIDRKNKRCWGQHVELVSQKIVLSHLRHKVDQSDVMKKKYGMPFCVDCQLPIGEPSTEDGEVKAKNRQDKELADGTPIA